MTAAATLELKTDAEIQACIAAQKELCENNVHYRGWHLAPHDGICHACHKNIYQNYGERAGYTGECYITGCCHCNASYCD